MKALENIQSKIVSTEEATAKILQWKAEGQTVVFTNGCFDILHKGHVTYLAKAADLGAKLVVALNTDASVKALGKSPERPINPEDARLLVIASLQFVDLVVLFPEETPLEMILQLQPSVLVKGADYDPNETDQSNKKYIVGSEEVRKAGGSVAVIDLVAGFSTTAILSKR
ncbi:MAG: adenylyltransferase/cytidyltransferase family protein [Crocinitomicaceae bacterium]